MAGALATLNEKEDGSLRRKKADDVPRGMGWGAQSAAAARISKIREKDPESVSDFGRYMAEKRRKLNVQYVGDSSNKLLSGATAAVAALHAKEGQIVVADSSIKSRLFHGISIWVDGFTIPSHQELRHLMLQYGGVFENYFRRDLVTHIICSTLPDSKINNPRMLSRGLPIVKPEWIVDSIAACRVLSWAPYQLQRIALENPNQRTIQATYSNPKVVHNPLPLDWRDANDNAVLDASTEPQQELLRLEDRGHSSSLDVPMVEAASVTEDLNTITEESAGKCLDTVLPTSPEPRAEAVNVGVKGGNSRKPSVGFSMADTAHSTLGDKNFVQNYFKASRLHFIGTWRNRYQSRYGSAGKNERSEGQEHQGFRANSGGDPAIIHIDMDCFFVAVVVRERPELDGKPVAVCHSDSARGTGEISSANYPARAFGVRAGMFVRDAKAKCPDLEIVPYNFEAYEQVADKVYDILHHHCGRVQAVSCDEAFLDVTDQGDPCKIASLIRSQIFEATRCSASAGVAGNMLLARLATRKAKPNGQYYIAPTQAGEFLAELAVEDLPGVGWTLKEKLHSHNLRKCPDLRRVSKDFLQREFGVKTGDMLWSYARGIDVREVQPAQERKSIGAEVNWGVRFLVPDDAQRFLVTLSKEVSTRLQTAAAIGRTITLKVKRRKEGTGEPSKFMGCGICDNFSRSETVAYATDSSEVLFRVGKQLFNSFGFDVRDVRGVGLQVTRLEAAGSGQSLKGGQGQQRAMESWLAPEPTKVTLSESVRPGNDTPINNRSLNVGPAEAAPIETSNLGAAKVEPAALTQNKTAFQTDSFPQQPRSGPSTSAEIKKSSISEKSGATNTKSPVRLGKKLKKPASTSATNLPALSELDPSVLASLPPEILLEIQEAYGELPAHHVVSSKSAPGSLPKAANIVNSLEPVQSEETLREGCRFDGSSGASLVETRILRGESSRPPSVNPEIVALPPASQLDPSVMAALPLSMRRELEREYKKLQVKNPPRPPAPQTNSEEKPKVFLGKPKLQREVGYSTSLKDLWIGSPPKWTHLFKDYKGAEFSNLSVLAERMACEPLPFSAVMLSLLPQLSSICSAPVDQTVVQSCVELFTQYAQKMVACDLEEVCMIMRVLKRVAVKSQLWRIVETQAIPFIQEPLTCSEIHPSVLELDGDEKQVEAFQSDLLTLNGLRTLRHHGGLARWIPGKHVHARVTRTQESVHCLKIFKIRSLSPGGICSSSPKRCNYLPETSGVPYHIIILDDSLVEVHFRPRKRFFYCERCGNSTSIVKSRNFLSTSTL